MRSRKLLMKRIFLPRLLQRRRKGTSELIIMSKQVARILCNACRRAAEVAEVVDPPAKRKRTRTKAPLYVLI